LTIDHESSLVASIRALSRDEPTSCGPVRSRLLDWEELPHYELVVGPMNSHEKQDQDRTVGERIAEVIRAHESTGKINTNREELDKLKAAAGRLEQLLAEAADAEKEDLKKAATRLDQLLKDLEKGKDVAPGFRVRREK
jgi:cell division protein ZapA (FtsZ GTPase activity inhibitor)